VRPVASWSETRGSLIAPFADGRAALGLLGWRRAPHHEGPTAAGPHPEEHRKAMRLEG